MYPDDEKVEELREQLMDYYGTAMTSGMPVAVIDIVRVENMNDDEVITEAQKNQIR